MSLRWIGMKMSIAVALCIVLLTNLSGNVGDQKHWWFIGSWGLLAFMVLMAHSQEFKKIRKKLAIRREYEQRLDWMRKEREYYQKQRRVQMKGSSYLR